MYARIICFLAQPVLEDNRGNIPIKFFGHPFLVESAETRRCPHGSIKVGNKIQLVRGGEVERGGGSYESP